MQTFHYHGMKDDNNNKKVEDSFYNRLYTLNSIKMMMSFSPSVFFTLYRMHVYYRYAYGSFEFLARTKGQVSSPNLNLILTTYQNEMKTKGVHKTQSSFTCSSMEW